MKARVEKGAKAPFSGVLLTDAALAKIIADYEAKIGRLKLDLEKAQREADARAKVAAAVCMAKTSGLTAELNVLDKGCAREREVLRKALDSARKRHWYQSPYVHFLLGTAISGAVCAGAIAADR